MKIEKLDKLHIALIAILLVGVLVGLSLVIDNRQTLQEPRAQEPLTQGTWKRTTYAAGDGTANQAIFTGAATLERIIIGETQSAGNLTIGDAVTPSINQIFNFGTGITKGVYEFGLDFDNGIMATVSSALNAIFIYTPK